MLDISCRLDIRGFLNNVKQCYSKPIMVETDRGISNQCHNMAMAMQVCHGIHFLHHEILAVNKDGIKDREKEACNGNTRSNEVVWLLHEV